ncbi:hypothetical protein SADUNF_Sadunf18G0075200 [Salix dunnii]|nr:hypothetical protein SADUNF_Sadunf18G0075200 [Salix dunnii]
MGESGHCPLEEVYRAEENCELPQTHNTSAKKKINTRESTTTASSRTLTVFRGREKMSKVPRRESPWGMPEGDNREPKAHRCNDRAEDVIQACFEGNPFKTVPGPFKLFWQCMRSKPGEEPTEPYTYLQIDPPRREVQLE